jgi:hypothetical protein
MPSMSREYCKKTPIKKMGFSQRASCKSQGIIARTSKKLKGKYLKSPKYRSKRKSRSRKRYDGSANKSLYNNGRKKPKTITGYGTKEKALETLKNIKKFDKTYQKQVVNTMYNRAKYHKYQTKGMRDSMKVYKTWLNKN